MAACDAVGDVASCLEVWGACDNLGPAFGFSDQAEYSSSAAHLTKVSVIDYPSLKTVL